MQALRAKVAAELEAPLLGSGTLRPCDRRQNPSSASPLPGGRDDNPLPSSLPAREGTALDLEWRGALLAATPRSSVSPDKSIYA